MLIRLGFLCILLTGVVARAETDWFASLYTQEGVELRSDERVFALYGVLNAMGYDQAPLARTLPIPKPRFHPVRSSVRQAHPGLDPELRRQLDAFFDAHPDAPERYLAYTVGGAKAAPELKGFETLLQKGAQQAKLSELHAAHQSEYRRALKGYLTVLDGPLARARKLLGQDRSTRLVIVANLLEADDRAVAVQAEGEWMVVVGPSEKPNPEAVVAAYARAVVSPAVARKTQNWAGGAQLLREAQSAGAGEKTVAEYAAAVVGRAIGLRATGANDTAYEGSVQAGYFAVKDVASRLEGGQPLESWLLEALARVEPRRPSKR